MTKSDKALLVKQGAKLTTLGAQVEAARGKLIRLVARGIPYDDQKMIKALAHFEKLDDEWKALEQEHLALRRRIGISD